MFPMTVGPRGGRTTQSSFPGAILAFCAFRRRAAWSRRSPNWTRPARKDRIDSRKFLPDGRHFLFTVRSSLADQTGVYAGSLDGKTKKLLIHGSTAALYAPSGHVLFLDGDTLMGQAFDAERLELKGQAFVVEGGVGRSSTGNGSYSVSGTGTLAYAGTLSTPGRLTWFDRAEPRPSR